MHIILFTVYLRTYIEMKQSSVCEKPPHATSPVYKAAICRGQHQRHLAAVSLVDNAKPYLLLFGGNVPSPAIPSTFIEQRCMAGMKQYKDLSDDTTQVVFGLKQGFPKSASYQTV